MMRILDLVALRSVVMVGECGSVTRAAELLNLTQSAVSMQIRRLEDMLGQVLFDRSQKRMVLSPNGEKIADYGRRMLRLNEEALESLGMVAGHREIVLGLPHDLIAPHIPHILRLMATAWPKVRLSLVVDLSKKLRERFAAGEIDVMLTTEEKPGLGGEALSARPLVWLGLPDFTLASGQALRIAMGRSCMFRAPVLDVLDKAGIKVIDALDGDSDAVITASVAAGMAITARLDGTEIQGCTALGPESGLPALPCTQICFYKNENRDSEALAALEVQLRRAYGESLPA